MERFNAETIPDIKGTVAKYAGKEIYGMALGDIVFDVMNLFPVYKASVSSLGLTMFHTIGNHDLDSAYNDLNNTADPLQNYGEQAYESYFGPADYSFNIGNVHVITMKNIDYFRGRKYTENITAPQIEWLKKDLSYLKEGTLVFLNLHAPTSNKTGKGAGNIKNAPELMEILKNFRVHIFAGHTHFYENQEVSPNIYEHNIGAACGTWWAGDVNRCGAPNGYLVVEVINTEVKWYYKATGQNSDYQFRIYKPGEFLSQPGFLVVNAWDWDTACKVNWYEDGQLKGSMEQFSDEDQDYISMVKMSKGYHTNHLFRVKPNAGSKNIKVEFVNRFGHVYSQELSLD
ncbi:MAG: TonB-dependent receptor [Bacteroidetes bacterium]|nr:TonB-dependent receptor [Bacteroidota bacterium]